MSEQSPFQGQPAYVEKTSSLKKRFIIIFFVILLLIITALAALYLLGSSVKHPVQPPTNPVPSVIPTTTQPSATNAAQLTSSPSATIAPSASPKSLAISVLNGSGVPGAAGKIADALTSAGFIHVTTGNAKTYTYTGITIYAKNNADLQSVQKAVATVDPSVKVAASIDNTIPGDVEIIVGK
jgi:LytR cell envelope-related transcriptional attenuator